MKKKMITDEGAQSAVNTIIEYCEQRYQKDKYMHCENCAIGTFCDELYKRIYDDCESWQDLRDYPIFTDEEGRVI